MDSIIAYTPLMARGALLTVTVAICSMALAALLGAFFAWAKLNGRPAVQIVASVYTTVVRGIPDLVLMLLFYFGGERLINAVRAVFGYERISVSPFVIGVVTIGFIFGAFLAETFRGAYIAIPRGQIEAALACGLPRWRMLYRIIIPQLMRFALPGFANTWLVLLKSTAIVSIVGLQDMVGIADKAGKVTREPFLFMLAVIVFFLLLTHVSGVLLGRVEQRYARQA